MNIHSVYAPFLRHFRKKRMLAFAIAFDIQPGISVLDVGGSPSIWELLPSSPNVRFVNVNATAMRHSDRGIIASGCALPFKDKSFDIVFSNSVIEHVGNLHQQRKFASECKRVGRRYYVQTPNRWFPVEPHLLAPFLHWLPERPRIAAAALSPWALITRPSRKRRGEYVRAIRLLTPSEMIELFPDAKSMNERFLGLRKSLIAVRL